MNSGNQQRADAQQQHQGQIGTIQSQFAGQAAQNPYLIMAAQGLPIPSPMQNPLWG